jgi:hypothetical protein
MNAVTIAGRVDGYVELDPHWTYVRLAVPRSSRQGKEPGVIPVNVRISGPIDLEQGDLIGLTGWLVDDGEHGKDFLEVECEAERVTKLGAPS